MLISTVVIGITCLLVGFTLGQNKVIDSRISNDQMSRELDAAQTRLAQLDSELVDAKLSVEVMREASNALREDMTGEHEKSARLQEEVAFYKGLMSPGSISKGLQVAELELVSGAAQGEFSYQLLLTQAALRRTYIAGDVRIDVIGRYGGGEEGEAVLSLTELAELKTYPVKFRFRYFQDLKGRIMLPSGFLPERVLVTAHQNGKEPLQVTFPWPQSEKSVNEKSGKE